MDYAEASYFNGYHFQHIAAWRDYNRLIGIAARARAAYQSGVRERRTGSRALHLV